MIAGLSALFIACKKSDIDTTITTKANNNIETSGTTGTSTTNTGAVSKGSNPIGSVDPALIGTWQLVSDSSSSYSQSLGSHGRTYKGTPADNFTFSSGGVAYIKEQTSIDTGYYGVSTDNSLQIVYPTRVIAGVQLGGSADFFKISSINEHNAILSNGGWSPAGVYFVRIVTLSK